MRLVKTCCRKQFKQMKRLYRQAFPPAERRPFSLIRKKTREGCMEMLSIEDEQGSFLGMVVMILYKDMALLDYFAISPEYRGKGIGTEVLQVLKQRYGNKRFFLEIENPEEECDNMIERKRRQAFYLNNGMTLLPDFMVNVFGTNMRILTHQCTVEFQEYQDMYTNTFGEKVRNRVICHLSPELKK
jgi:GNAT superfamily N-acetyltransferase